MASRYTPELTSTRSTPGVTNATDTPDILYTKGSTTPIYYTENTTYGATTRISVSLTTSTGPETVPNVYIFAGAVSVLLILVSCVVLAVYVVRTWGRNVEVPVLHNSIQAPAVGMAHVGIQTQVVHNDLYETSSGNNADAVAYSTVDDGYLSSQLCQSVHNNDLYETSSGNNADNVGYSTVDEAVFRRSVLDDEYTIPEDMNDYDSLQRETEGMANTYEKIRKPHSV